MEECLPTRSVVHSPGQHPCYSYASGTGKGEKEPMDRRHLLTSLLGLGAAGLAGAARAAPAQRKTRLRLHDSHIAGTAYYDFERVAGQLRAGDALTPRREPDNPYDPRAVELYWKGVKLGYLPRLDNAAVAGLMDRGYAIQITLARKGTALADFPGIRIHVRV